MIIIVYDDLANDLGMYFKACAEQLVDTLKTISLKQKLVVIEGSQLNQARIDLLLESRREEEKTIFVAYSHGRERDLIANEGVYVGKDLNDNHFQNTIVYTNACWAGKELGRSLIDKNSIAFIGYKDSVDVVGLYNQNTFMNCDNYGIILLFHNYTTKQAYQKMKNYYNRYIDNIIDNYPNRIIEASALRNNRDALCFYGENVKIF